MKIVNILILAFIFLCASNVKSQVTIGSQDTPHPAALLDLKAVNKGVILPKVAFIKLDSFALIASPTEQNLVDADGMLIYNTSTGIPKGVYQWNNQLATWDKLLTQRDPFRSLVSGYNNADQTNTQLGVVVGGAENLLTSHGGAVIGGYQNQALSDGAAGYSAILGGGNNTTAARYSTIVGGQSNAVTGWYAYHSTILGGISNTIYSTADGILAGTGNKIGHEGNPYYAADYSTILGGANNTIDGPGGGSPVSGSMYSSIVGGHDNKIDANSYSSAILTGNNNAITSTGNNSAILSGLYNSVSAGYSLAAGIGASITHTGNVLFCDAIGGTTSSVSDHQFTGLYKNGFRFLYDRANPTSGVFINGSTLTAGSVVSQGDIQIVSGTLVQLSDARYKKEVKQNIVGLNFINKLNPVSFQWDETKVQDADQKRHSGFMAQEVQEAAQKSGFDFDGVTVPSNPEEKYSVSYLQMIVPLVKAVQELSKQNEELKAEVEILKSKVK